MHYNSSMSDENLAVLSQRGCKDAFSSLTVRFLPTITAKAHNFKTYYPDKDDLIQEGLIGLMWAVRKFNPSKGVSFATFANVCILSKILSAANSLQNNKHYAMHNYLPIENLSDCLFMTEDKSNYADPFQIVAAQEESEQLQKKAQSVLSKLEHDSFMLYINGHSYEEIATILRLTTKTVDNALQRVRKKLRNII